MAPPLAYVRIHVLRMQWINWRLIPHRAQEIVSKAYEDRLLEGVYEHAYLPSATSRPRFLTTMSANAEESSSETQVCNHGSLGRLRGAVHPTLGTVQYRGIPYAHISRRWADPVLSNFTSRDAIYDATKHGPICPQQNGGLQYDFALYGDVSLPCVPLESSEFHCLNAVVTIPKVIRRMDKLPVVVLYGRRSPNMTHRS